MSELYFAEELTEEEYEQLKDEYYDEYDYMYDNYDEPSTEEFGSYPELVDTGEDMGRAEVPFLIQFVRERMDPLSSDRELAAFALVALKHGYVWYE